MTLTHSITQLHSDLCANEQENKNLKEKLRTTFRRFYFAIPAGTKR